MLRAQPAEPVLEAVSDQAAAEVTAQAQVPGEAPPAVLGLLARFCEPGGTVLAHGVEQPAAAAVGRKHDGLVYQPAQYIGLRGAGSWSGPRRGYGGSSPAASRSLAIAGSKVPANTESRRQAAFSASVQSP